MKKFKYPLAITGPVEELKALVPELERLGWSWGKQKWWNRQEKSPNLLIRHLCGMTKRNLAIFEAYTKGYRVSEDGTVFYRGSKVKGYNKGDRYLYVSVRLDGESIGIGIHRLQAYQKFGSAIFEKGIQARHLDSNPHNNSRDNIAIGDAHMNKMDMPKARRIKLSINASSKKRRFTDKQVEEIIKAHESGVSYMKLCRKYNTSKSTLSYLFNKAYYTGQRAA